MTPVYGQLGRNGANLCLDSAQRGLDRCDGGGDRREIIGLSRTQPLHGREGLLLELDECVELV